MKRLIFLSCLIVLTAAACIFPRERPPAAELPVKTGEETGTPAVAAEPAVRHVSPPQSLLAGREAFVPPQEASETAAPGGEPDEPAEHPSETAPSQPLAQAEPVAPSTVFPTMIANPSSVPQSGDKRMIGEQAEIWIPGFGWIPDNGGGSIGTIATSDGDINKMVGYMGSDDPPKRESSSPPSEPYIPKVGDVQIDILTGIQVVLTEDSWVEQSFDDE